MLFPCSLLEDAQLPDQVLSLQYAQNTDIYGAGVLDDLRCTSLRLKIYRPLFGITLENKVRFLCILMGRVYNSGLA